MRTCLTVFIFILMLQKGVSAQWDQSNRQDSIIAKLGIVRMLTQTVTSSLSARESARSRTTETFFDSLGRTISSVNDACSSCGTIIEYDSVTGLVSYMRMEWQNGVVENYTAYDTKKRRISTESCKSNNKECEIHVFEYDDDNTERMYKISNRKHMKLDTSKHSTHFLRLYSVGKEEKQLAHEIFFSPEGQLEETKLYRDGKFQHSLIYEYYEEGRQVRVWNFDGKIKTLLSENQRNGNGQTITANSYILLAGDPLLEKRDPIVHAYEYDENGLLTKSTIGSAVSEFSYFTD